METSDLIVLIKGCPVPLVLRPKEVELLDGPEGKVFSCSLIVVACMTPSPFPFLQLRRRFEVDVDGRMKGETANEIGSAKGLTLLLEKAVLQ